MKKINWILFVIFSILTLDSQASLNPIDSISFEEQRIRVNSLLDERADKFGDYDVSLTQKTGIFGLFKTKDDMQRSLDILQEIVKMDNKIFIETRRLLVIKDGEAEKYQKLATEYDNQVTAYMKTISKLQVENEKLRTKLDTVEDDYQSNNTLFFILGLIIIALLFIVLRQYKMTKTKKLTKV